MRVRGEREPELGREGSSVQPKIMAAAMPAYNERGLATGIDDTALSAGAEGCWSGSVEAWGWTADAADDGDSPSQ